MNQKEKLMQLYKQGHISEPGFIMALNELERYKIQPKIKVEEVKPE